MSKTDLELYWIRHGESEMNTLPTFSGRSNETRLTPKGVEQSKQLGRFLAKQDIFPSVVYVSPAIRTVQTAEFCLAEMGLDIKPLVSDALQELDQGEWVGQVRERIWNDEAVIAEIEELGKDYKQGGAESINEAAMRGLGWITETFDTYIPKQIPDRQFIFSHAVLIASMAAHINNWPHEEVRASRIPNASINLFSRQNGEWNIEYLSREPEQD